MRAAFDVPLLAYAERPRRITGGFETTILRFSLSDPPPVCSGPLIVRILQPHYHPDQIRLEAAVQSALASVGYPAPRAVLVGADPAILGGAFMVMPFVDGQPLAKGMDTFVSGAAVGRVLRLVIDVPRVVEQIARVWADAQVRLHALPVEAMVRALSTAGLQPSAYTFEARLAVLGREINALGLTGVKPALDWLVAHQPPAAATAICHCDFHPLNILVEDGRITGVIDWGNVTLGDPALDVGSTIAAITTTPLGVPAWLRPIVRGLLSYALWRYRRVYGRQRSVDAAAVRYYRVFRSLWHLVGALRGARRGGAPAGAHGRPEARQLLVARIQALSGVRISVEGQP
ncbi:phosphotransferase family protein [Reyranella sp. CPCC 100927]|uniref:phosphotransferase family protein n=1 Tax=Reyranella sp. CPCC 100927 TaxID=2599616 RepID=UPI0011B415A6|nr:phosphotransferase family protein [Reyranella sp. CPCC 100927]TWT15527.1 phosphotransferase family protein [Reyranella sp. CPCC 100927]